MVSNFLQLHILRKVSFSEPCKKLLFVPRNHVRGIIVVILLSTFCTTVIIRVAWTGRLFLWVRFYDFLNLLWPLASTALIVCAILNNSTLSVSMGHRLMPGARATGGFGDTIVLCERLRSAQIDSWYVTVKLTSALSIVQFVRVWHFFEANTVLVFVRWLCNLVLNASSLRYRSKFLQNVHHIVGYLLHEL